MKEPREWDEEYLYTLPVGEFDWLEVKGRRALDMTLANVDESKSRQNLSIEISAFANSGGGVLVLGLSNPTKIWSVDDGGIDLTVKRPSTREWLEDIVPNLVEPPLQRFNIYVIQNTSDSSQIVTGRGIFIIEIADSEQAPHQATDNRYYARVGGKSRPLRHRLIADIFGRRQNPKLSVSFKIRAGTSKESAPNQFVSVRFMQREELKTRPTFRLIAIAKNVGRVLAKYVSITMFIPVALLPEKNIEYGFYKAKDFKEIDGVSYLIWNEDNTRRDYIKSEGMGAQYGPSWFDPILPGLAHIWDRRLPDQFDKTKLGDLKILWKVSADNTPTEDGSIFIRDIDVFRDE